MWVQGKALVGGPGGKAPRPKMILSILRWLRTALLEAKNFQLYQLKKVAKHLVFTLYIYKWEKVDANHLNSFNWDSASVVYGSEYNRVKCDFKRWFDSAIGL